MWPFNYFKKKREKAEREHLCQKEEAPLHKLNQESIACERADQAEENHSKTSRTERAEAEFLQPFTFKSNCHQRYENGSPVKGVQECSRTVSVIKNTNGHPSYRLEPGIGYIVKIYNEDLGKPNMSDKPMKVIRKTETFIELHGFPIDAQFPFGWQEVDYSDYGFIVYYKNGQVEKCVLHMYDRNPNRIKLRCYIVLEFKVVAFEPEFAGKLNFYITAVNHLLKGKDDNPTIGLLICSDMRKTEEKCSFGTINAPIGVATYSNIEEIKVQLTTAEQQQEHIKLLEYEIKKRKLEKE